MNESRFIPYFPSMPSGILTVTNEGQHEMLDAMLQGGSISVSDRLQFATGGIVSRPEPERISAKQIHAEVYAESDVLLEPVGEMTAPAPVESEEIGILRKMGFTANPQVVRTEIEMQGYEREKQALQSKKIVYDAAVRYALRYPNYKFITRQALDKVCNKYGLKTKSVNQFIGAIPAVNVAEIARFYKQVVINPQDEDQTQTGYFISATPDQFDDYAEMMRQKQEQEMMRAQLMNSFSGYRPSMTPADYQRWLVEDPIVLKPVQHGFLIVACWGDEASDVDVQNERHN